MIEIKHRWNDSRVIYKSETAVTLREAVLEAVSSKAPLQYADLRAADLSAADLRDANLSAADLRDANLRAANLRDANLRAANLRDANLSAANLSAADLSAADLSAADLRDANLSAADLRDADLSAADLRDANLRAFKNDFFEILLNAPGEIDGLEEKLLAGEIDGSCYNPSCGMACLVGTIAILRKEPFLSTDVRDGRELPGIKPDGSRPAEVWFFNISPGCTPDKNAVAAITLGWIQEFKSKIAAFVALKPKEGCLE